MAVNRKRVLRWWARANWGAAGLWLLLIYPTVKWWHDSITWLVIMSLWANFAGHLAAALAAEED